MVYSELNINMWYIVRQLDGEITREYDLRLWVDNFNLILRH